MRLTGFFCAARAALGTTYLLFPALPARAADSGHDERSARVTARVLGARHLAQAVATSGRPPATVLALGAEADAAHAASMVVLSLLSRQWRRAALTDALITTVLTATGIAAAVRSGPGEPAATGWPSARDRYARRLAPVLIPQQIWPGERAAMAWRPGTRPPGQ